MTIPEHIREEAERLSSNWAMPECEETLRTAIATALLAAEQREMERAAGIAETHFTQQEHGSNAVRAGHMLAAAIRKAREERG